jgi:UMF1 family MFS transporter
MRRREIVSWCLYDFANSIYAAVIVATIWAAYYANVIVGNATGLGDLWWGRAVSTTMLLVAVTSPVAGAMAGIGGRRKTFLILYTLMAVAGTATLVTVRPGMVVAGFLLTVLATFGFEGAMVFYNAYLPELAAPERRGRLSGWGYATGYAGSILGLILALPLVKAERYAEAFIMVAVCFALFALPALLWLPSDRRDRIGMARAVRDGLGATWQTLREIAARVPLRRFLLAYFLYIDGVNTIIYFSSIFAAHTLGFAMTELITVFLVVQATALLGSAAWAAPTDRLGPRRVLLWLLAQWVVVVICAYFVTGKPAFYLLAALAGTALGATQAASRAFLAQLIPAGRESEYFGFYALCGKTASILGPLVFGTVSALSAGNQRLSVLSVLVFLLAGGVLLWGVRADDGAIPCHESAPVSGTRH